ncbi:MAG TPA: histidine phosphatase family protein [Anaeromyxobacter sp.]|nr:histidine phosphatase family protein [Anaeromyxobacter sp.]
MTCSMEIVLVRHGRVAFDRRARVHQPDLAARLAQFREAGIVQGTIPPPKVRRLAERVAHLTSSDLPRAVESARALARSQPVPADALFREADVPPDLPLPLPLRFSTWVALGRLAWLLGYTSQCESGRQVRERARRAALRLAQLASQHGSVMLVGHGYFNILLARELRRLGFQGPRLGPRRNWSAARFCKPR